jgi:predicted ATPase
MTTNKYPRGSEWRKWDLHVHTPDTAKNDQFGSGEDKWEEYISKLESNEEISVLGITDYFSIDNYLLLKKKQEEGRLSDKTLIPNVELRILPVTRTDTPINIHVFFDPNLPIETINREFFQCLKFKYSGNEYSCLRQDLIALGRLYRNNDHLEEYCAKKEGIAQFNISYNELDEVLKKPSLRNYVVIAVSNSNRDGNSGIQHSSLAATRQEIYRMSDIIFSANDKDIQYFLGEGVDDEETIKQKYGSLKPCVIGSDAHSIDAVNVFPNNKTTWIKADPTFEGLKQILIEPENRVFIGEKPRIFKTVDANRTKYINELLIDAVDGYSGIKGKWFEKIQIPFNKELIAIIGNKGNGKSAISDILAHCCNYKVQKYFSFLNDDKFRNKNLAGNFAASVEFADGQKEKKELSDKLNGSEITRVKYLPQGYFESICNDLQKEENLKDEIEAVVFQYIDESSRLGTSNFKELIAKKSDAIELDIQLLQNKLSNVNKEIIILEDKEHPAYKASVNATIEQKEKEITALVAPPEVPKPSPNDEQSKETVLKIEKLKEEIVALNDSIQKLTDEKSGLLIQLSKINDLIIKVNRIAQSIREFKEENKSFVESLGGDINTIISGKKDTSLLEKKQLEFEGRLREIEKLIVADSQNEDNLVFAIKKKQDEIISLQAKLDGPSKAYQSYLQQKEEYEKNKRRIEGDEATPNTLKWLKKEKEYVENSLSEDLQKKAEERNLCLKEIYNKRKEIISIYQQVKSKLDSKIEENKSLLKDYEIKIGASLGIRNTFPDEFLRFVNQSKSGSFRGKDTGLTLVQELIKESDIQNEDGIEAFCNSFINKLKTDDERPFYVKDQVEDRQSLYDYLFSLDYLTNNYSILQGDKDLSVLSPGEKGALLLVFYLLLDMDNIPLILDQPEDNLDNDSVANILVDFIKEAKKKRQIIMVTHNPNLAVVADAEQIIYVSIDKEDGNKVYVESGSIENPNTNKHIVDVLEGAMPAFRKRDNKYIQ